MIRHERNASTLPRSTMPRRRGRRRKAACSGKKWISLLIKTISMICRGYWRAIGAMMLMRDGWLASRDADQHAMPA